MENKTNTQTGQAVESAGEKTTTRENNDYLGLLSIIEVSN